MLTGISAVVALAAIALSTRTRDAHADAPAPRVSFTVELPPQLSLDTGVGFNYAVAPDGQFLINTVKLGTPPPSIRVILNWQQPEE